MNDLIEIVARNQIAVVAAVGVSFVIISVLAARDRFWPLVWPAAIVGFGLLLTAGYIQYHS